MITEKLKVNGLDLFIVPSGFVFVRQTCVKFYGKRLSKHELIICCEYFISELKYIYSSERLKIGFNLKCFKYYELSVYLHGLISLLCSKVNCACPSCFGLFKFSRLPHDVMKPEKETKHIDVIRVSDVIDDTSYYCCVIGGRPICHCSQVGLRDIIDSLFPNLIRKYNIVLDVK